MYTKKVGSQRGMKKIEDWYGVNKSTPDQWFHRWEQFLVSLMSELGYQCVGNESVKKPKGKHWSKTMKFTHSSLDDIILYLSRNRRQEGGSLCLVYDTYEATIETLSDEVMSRQKVGGQILGHIREGWSKSKNVNQED
jgi:hypothetical protein